MFDADALAERCFDAAWNAFPASRSWEGLRLSIGNRSVDIHCADAPVGGLIRPAMAHLTTLGDRGDAAGAGVADFHVRAWSATATFPAPKLPVSEGDMLVRDRVAALCTDRFHTVMEAHFRTITLVDRVRRRALYCAHDPETVPYYERAAPLRALWLAWLAPHGALPVHGAAVSRAGEGLLLTAPGGNGKSTTALLALDAGWEYLADDWCLVENMESNAPAPALHSLYNTTKLRPDNLVRFPNLQSAIHNHDKLDDEKATIFLHSVAPEKLKRSARLRAIVVPHVGTGSETTFALAPAATAFHAMVGVTSTLAGAGREVPSLLLKLCKAAPVYQLTLGHDLPGVTRALDQLLDHAKNRT